MTERQIARASQDQLVDHRLEDQIQSDESLAPIVGDQLPFHELAQRLPARVLFPKSFAVSRLLET